MVREGAENDLLVRQCTFVHAAAYCQTRCISAVSIRYRAVNTFLLGYNNQITLLHRAKVALCSEIDTKHISTVWAERRIVEC